MKLASVCALSLALVVPVPAAAGTPAGAAAAEARALPVPVARVQPDYPGRALRNHIGGHAVVVVYVNDEGRVTYWSIREESPAGAGFGAATLAAARRWRFEPGKPGHYVLEHVFKTEAAAYDPISGPPEQQGDAPLEPVYPQTAKAARVSGDVLLRVTVRSDGRVSHVEIVKEHPKNFGFGSSAAAAVRTWPFPKHSPGDYEVPIHFDPPA
jgi:TonB family protein